MFYDEINRRLVETNRGSSDTLFISAQNWQTTGDITAPLREVGIPTAIIMDIDVLRIEASGWRKIPKACHLPSNLLSDLNTLQKAVLIEVPNDDRKKKEFKDKGLHFLSNKLRIQAESVIDQLKEYGIFIVPIGELECWLSNLGIPKDPKKTWIRRIFHKMGATVDDPNYLKPGPNDVWKFMDDIANWIKLPSRKGM
jgi:hypothetical protein